MRLDRNSISNTSRRLRTKVSGHLSAHGTACKICKTDDQKIWGLIHFHIVFALGKRQILFFWVECSAPELNSFSQFKSDLWGTLSLELDFDLKSSKYPQCVLSNWLLSWNQCKVMHVVHPRWRCHSYNSNNYQPNKIMFSFMADNREFCYVCPLNV